ncbi:MAG TPA: hypothetical protein VFF59_11845, partial [Anaerolineae bacterium]|nr:hypothetical protein [Anaerolineae bacterium]
AAYNGALIAGVGLTAYCMYLLARSLGFDRLIAFFAGLMLMMAPMHLAGLLGHLDKTFLGFLPLTLLALHRALDLTRGRRWSILVGVLLLITLLYDGWHFVLAALAVAFFLLVAWISIGRSQGWRLFKRQFLIGVSILICVVPVLIAVQSAAAQIPVTQNRNLASADIAPDLIEFFLPARSSWLFGADTEHFLETHAIQGTIETTVSLAYIGLLLCGLAVFSRDRSVWRWLLFCIVCMLFASGPELKVLGTTQFTEYKLPIMLPYAVLTALPGLDFMRAPGRFMLIGFVGFGIAASYGLAWLRQRARRWRYPIVLLAIAGLLIETWPQAWPQEQLRSAPPFYQQIANDSDMYGVFDLPIKPLPDTASDVYSSHYQVYQMTHRKGIAVGYLSFNYPQHPFLPCFFARKPRNEDVLVNGRVADCALNGQFELARYNYRYVVFHKPQPGYADYQPGSWGEAEAQLLIKKMFGDQPPLIDDALTQVYRVAPTVLTTTLTLGTHWFNREEDWRWAASPATLNIISPRHQAAQLVITLGLLFDPSAADPTAVANPDRRGVLNVSIGDRVVANVPAVLNQELRVPLELEPGLQIITLNLQAGNFHLSDYGGDDDRALSFAIHAIDVQLAP